jgi:hypothetical protein
MFQQEKGENTEFKDAVTGLAHFEAHGDRWSSLDENDALALAVVMDRLFQRGGFEVKELPGKYDMLIQPYGDCRAAALVSENEEGQPGVDSVYPLLLGRKNALRVTHLHEWGIPAEAEGDVYAESEACGKLAFFDPFWCRDREALAARKEDGAEADFLLSAWAYRVQKAGEAEAPALRRHQVATEYLFRFKVLATSPTEFCGYLVWRLTVELSDGAPLYLYASERSLGGLLPKAGDELEGQLWLCGHLADAFAEWKS